MKKLLTLLFTLSLFLLLAGCSNSTSNDTISKKIWVTLKLSTSDIDEAISKGLLKICQSKQDVQFEGIIYSKSS